MLSLFILLSNTQSLLLAFLAGVLLTLLILAIFLYIKNNNTTSEACSMEYGKVSNKMIPIDMAKELFDSYTNDKLSKISPLSGNRDHARFGEYPFGFFIDYCKYLECLDDYLLLSNPYGIKSLRFYLASYPTTYNRPPQQPDQQTYAGQSTFFVVPTTLNADGTESEFCLTLSGVKWIPYFYGDFYNTSNPGANAPVHTSTILNEINLTPPPN